MIWAVTMLSCGIIQKRKVRCRKRLSKYNFLSSAVRSLTDLSQVSCNICLCNVDPSYVILPCGHVYCSVCIHHHTKLHVSPRCPLCKQHYTEKDVGESGVIEK